jgi:hypothetical protein
MATMTLSYDQQIRQQASARVYQARYEDALAPWDQRAPAPTLGQSVEDYRRETLIKIKKLLPENHELRSVTIRRLPSDILDAFEPQFLQACRTEAYNPETVPAGHFRKVIELDSNGQKIVRFVGPESFVKQMGRPGRRVVSFLTPHGPVDASGRFLR